MRWVLGPSEQGLGKLWGRERQTSRDMGSTAPQQLLHWRPSEKELPAPSGRPLTQQAVRRQEPGLELRHSASRPSSTSPSRAACGSFVTGKVETLIEGGGRLSEMVHVLQRTAPRQPSGSANTVIRVPCPASPEALPRGGGGWQAGPSLCGAEVHLL